MKRQKKNKRSSLLLKGHKVHKMSNVPDVVESSVDAMGGLTLYSGDTTIPDYVSSASVSTVGSSVSQSKKNTIEVNAEMFNNAMAMLLNLQTQVFLIFFHLFHSNNK
jgi:hypothetical protein